MGGIGLSGEKTEMDDPSSCLYIVALLREVEVDMTFEPHLDVNLATRGRVDVTQHTDV